MTRRSENPKGGGGRSDRLSRLMRSKPSPALAVAFAGLFVALGGTAIATQSSSGGSTREQASAQRAPAGANVAKKSKRGPRGPQGPAGPQGPQGPIGPAGPSTGAAGGDLTGSYPNPSIGAGAVDTAQLADGAVNTAKLEEHAVIGDKVDHDTLTGVNIDESTLTGVSPSGAAGGGLAGTFPNPNLNVSGGPCANGKALTNLSATAHLTCATGVYLDGRENIGVSFNPFGSIGPSSDDNTAVGATALESTTTGGGNSAFGAYVLSSNTTGGANSALGRWALESNTVGGGNSALGSAALRLNVDGDENTAVGKDAMFNNTSGELNSALGRGALYSNTTGVQNSAVGTSAMFANTEGTHNAALGTVAMSVNTTGSHNAAVGGSALQNNTDGDNNAALGSGALLSNSTGSDNTALGREAGRFLTTGNNNIDIANVGVPGESATTRIGANGTQTQAFIAGIRDVTVGAGPVPVLIDPNGQLGTTNSSRRYKTDINPLGAQSDPLMKLNPVSFRYREGPSELQYGLIAEQVAKVMPTLAVYDRQGLPQTVQYQDLPVLLLNEVQEQRRKIARQQAQIDWLMQRVTGP